MWDVSRAHRALLQAMDGDDNDDAVDGRIGNCDDNDDDYI